MERGDDAGVGQHGRGLLSSRPLGHVEAEGTLVGTLLVTAVVVMILGMGVPTTAAYVLAASVLAVALQKIGFGALEAHMFIFYFATLSAITPPVCPAVFVAAGMASAHSAR